MTDEAFVCVEDIRERKRTARGIHNKRTHNGKGGRVKTPSDYLTRKERLEMSGECVSWRLNAPMTWEELKTAPDDIQEQYLRLIVDRYHPEKTAVADMLGITIYRMDLLMKKYGLVFPRGGNRPAGRNDAFDAWRHGVPLAVEEKAQVEIPKEEPVEAASEIIKLQDEIKAPEDKKENEMTLAFWETMFKRCKAPESGRIVMSGTPAEIAKTIATFLGAAEIRCTVEWEVL
jgi:hypothetical protein